jgi:hypothetical protein
MEFFLTTPSIAKKKNKNNGVETYETLIAKEKFFNNQKAIIEREIERLQKGTGT